MSGGLLIRAAVPADAAAIAAIYAHHVRHSVATFDTVAPPTARFRQRIGAIPVFLVAERNGAILGYAYAAPFRDRAAYAATCEDSIYLHPDHLGRGIGRALLEALIEAATRHGFRQMIAVIGDERVSAPFHARAGFREAGRIRSVGRKFGRWIDVLFMQRELGPGSRTPPDAEP